MTEQSVVTDAMRRAVGVESEPKTHLVEAGAIRKFADAIGDPSPAYRERCVGRSRRPADLPEVVGRGPSRRRLREPLP